MSLNHLTYEDFENLLHTAGFSNFPSSKNFKVAVAVSGGADSLALTLLLHHWAKGHSVKLVALTVDHGLRCQSTQEARDLQALLKQQSIEHHILTWEGEKPVTALQERAREKRYSLLKDWCLDRGYDFLFLGHHLGDQQETYCMRLRKKSGLLGLACMRPLIKHQTLTLVRPFLEISKAQLQKTLNFFQVKWVEDPSNNNITFERVFWRQKIDQLFYDLTPFQKVRKAYEGWIMRYLEAHAHVFDLGYVRLDKRAFDILPKDFQGILISFLLKAYGTGRYPLSSVALSRVLRRLKQVNFSATTAQGLRISKQKDFLFMIREYRNIKEERESLRTPFIWDKRFLIAPHKELTGVIKCVGEKGWWQLLEQNPELRTIEAPRPVLWSLPSLWDKKGKIHPTANGIVEAFCPIDKKNHRKMFVFRSKSPF